jgi:hypothetical protein
MSTFSLEAEDALFHYTKTSNALENILYTGKLRLGFLINTNDPREYKDKIQSAYGWALPANADQQVSEAIGFCKKVIHKIRVLSFCTNAFPSISSHGVVIKKEETANIVGWNKPRMWSQYGEEHHGICLVFSKNALIEGLENNKGRIKEFLAQYIRYESPDTHSFRTSTIDINRLLVEGLEPYCTNHIMENKDDLFFTKDIDYRDESEYRFIVYDPDDKMEYIEIANPIRYVIAGDRIHEMYLPIIKELCSGYGIERRRVQWYGSRSLLLPF